MRGIGPVPAPTDGSGCWHQPLLAHVRKAVTGYAGERIRSAFLCAKLRSAFCLDPFFLNEFDISDGFLVNEHILYILLS